MEIHVYGINQDGTLWKVDTHTVYNGNIRSALSGYRAYEQNRAFVEKGLTDGVAVEASWDGNRYGFSPYPLDAH